MSDRVKDNQVYREASLLKKDSNINVPDFSKITNDHTRHLGNIKGSQAV